jgi:GxxExxY protein
MLHEEITQKIIKAFYKVYNTLGYGFLEKVYQKALLIELRKIGLNCREEAPVKVYYEDQLVGDYRADIIVENCVIIENKTAEALAEENEYQLINYLKATEIEIGLLLNFGKTPEFKRKIFTNDRKLKNTPVCRQGRDKTDATDNR